MTCPLCKLESPPGSLRCDCGLDFATGMRDRNGVTPKALPADAGYISAALALCSPWLLLLPMRGLTTSFLPFLIPAVFGFAAVILGAVGIMRGQRAQGTGQIVAGLLGGCAGFMLGLTMGTGFDR
jgi:hypothetical protein